MITGACHQYRHGHLPIRHPLRSLFLFMALSRFRSSSMFYIKSLQSPFGARLLSIIIIIKIIITIHNLLQAYHPFRQLHVLLGSTCTWFLSSFSFYRQRHLHQGCNRYRQPTGPVQEFFLFFPELLVNFFKNQEQRCFALHVKPVLSVSMTKSIKKHIVVGLY